MMILSIASLISLVGLSIGAPLSETARKHPFKTLGHKAWKETKELTPIMIGGGVAAATAASLTRALTKNPKLSPIAATAIAAGASTAAFVETEKIIDFVTGHKHEDDHHEHEHNSEETLVSDQHSQHHHHAAAAQQFSVTSKALLQGSKSDTDDEENQAASILGGTAASSVAGRPVVMPTGCCPGCGANSAIAAMACARPSADKKTASSVDGNEVIGAEDAVATIADSTTPILPPVQKPHVHGPGCCGGHGKASSHARRVVPAEDTLAGMIAGEEAVSSIPHM